MVRYGGGGGDDGGNEDDWCIVMVAPIFWWVLGVVGCHAAIKSLFCFVGGSGGGKC